MKYLMVLLLALSAAACNESGSGASSAADSGPAQPGAPSVISHDLTVESGAGFSCWLETHTLWCWGSNGVLGLNSAAPVPFARNTTNPITAFLVRDNTVCFETRVSAPNFGTTGNMVYCAGYATIDSGAISYEVNNGLAKFSPPVVPGDLSSELTTEVLPYLIEVGALSLLANQGSSGLLQDSTTSVATSTLTCEQDGADLICPQFTFTTDGSL